MEYKRGSSGEVLRLVQDVQEREGWGACCGKYTIYSQVSTSAQR